MFLNATAYYAIRKWDPVSNPEDILRRHANHCLVILRQVVICQPDTGVYSQD